MKDNAQKMSFESEANEAINDYMVIRENIMVTYEYQLQKGQNQKIRDDYDFEMGVIARSLSVTLAWIRSKQGM